MEKLPPSKIIEKNLKNRKNYIYFSKKTQKLLGSSIVFSIYLKYHMHLLQKGIGFSMHPLHAQYFFKKRIIINLPIEFLQYFMHDWVKLDSNTIHTSDYFLSNQNLISISHDVEKMQVYRLAKELASNNWNYKSTQSYQTFCTALEQGKPISKQHVLLNSTEAINAYFERFQKLHDSIKTHGLLSNANFRQFGAQHQDREIGIAIDQSGNIIKLQGGQHRFALAKILNISHIPVEIRMVHTDLLQQICKIHKKSPIEAVLWVAHRLASEQAVC